MFLELRFPVSGAALPTDHSYPLYGALAGVIPEFHENESPLRFAPISGVATPDGRLLIDDRSKLIIRLPDDRIKTALPLAGKRLLLGESPVRLGVPAVRTLVPAPNLVARIVTFKNADQPDQFLTTAREKLAELGIAGEPQLPIHFEGERAGEPKRRVVRIKGVAIPGFALLVSELSAEDSIKLQETGLGGRTHIGCGFFVPAKAEGK